MQKYIRGSKLSQKQKDWQTSLPLLNGAISGSHCFETDACDFQISGNTNPRRWLLPQPRCWKLALLWGTVRVDVHVRNKEKLWCISQLKEERQRAQRLEAGEAPLCAIMLDAWLSLAILQQSKSISFISASLSNITEAGSQLL